MPSITSNTSFNLNGSTPFTIGGITQTWFNRSIGYIDTWDQTIGAPHTVGVAFSGANWYVGTIRFTGNLRPTIADASTGNVIVTTIQLFGNHGSTVTLNRASVGSIFGERGADIITTSNLATSWTDFIHTGAGNDRITTRLGYVGFIEAFDGNDAITTGQGWVSTVSAGHGFDVVTIGRGCETVDLADGGGRVITGTQWTGYVNAYGNFSEAVTTRTGNVGFINLGAGNDTVRTGTGFVSSVALGDGNDIITLGSSNIRSISGGNGNDRFVLGAFTPDLIVGGDGIDAVYSTISRSLAAAQSTEYLILQGAAAINGTGNGLANAITGNNAANILSGGAGNDSLSSLAGNDRLIGGDGNDTMNGGAGNDTFLFNTRPNALTNRDTIVGFVAVNDTIQLENAVFASLTPGLLLPASFRTGTAALDADDRIIYNTTTGALIYDSNGNAAGGAVHFATLAGHPAITAADFVVI